MMLTTLAMHKSTRLGYRIQGGLVFFLLLYGVALSALPIIDPFVDQAKLNDSRPTLTSSVSEEFRNGIHEQYLEYLADQLDMKLVIIPMTYNRRITSLKNGTIDIMAGLRSTYDTEGKFEYLQPSYTSSSSRFFFKVGTQTKLKDKGDLSGLTIAITVTEKTYQQSLEKLGANVIIVPRLAQKIKLLLMERIDAFEHVESSALDFIQQHGHQSEIAMAEYKPKPPIDFHFAISTSSPLMSMKGRIEDAIANGLSTGAFTAIRARNYQP